MSCSRRTFTKNITCNRGLLQLHPIRMWNTCNRPRHMGQSHDPLTRHCEKMWIPTCHGFRFSKDLGLFPWIAFYINDTVIGTLSIEPAPHPLIAFLKIEFYNKFAPKWRALLETFLSQIWSKVHVMLVTADDTWQVSSGGMSGCNRPTLHRGKVAGNRPTRHTFQAKTCLLGINTWCIEATFWKNGGYFFFKVLKLNH